MNRQTPDTIRTLQKRLYGKVMRAACEGRGAEPRFRFRILYDKVWWADIPAHVDDLARSAAGAPVETTDRGGDSGQINQRRKEGGRTSRQGVPQGGVISPLIAGLSINRMLKYWRQTGRGRWQAHVINYTAKRYDQLG